MKASNIGKQINTKRVIEMIEQYTEKNDEKWLEVGRNLRRERKKLGITVYHVGDLLGTSPSRVSKLENGKSITMVNQLITSYKLVLEYEKLKKKNAISKARLIERIISDL